MKRIKMGLIELFKKWFKLMKLLSILAMVLSFSTLFSQEVNPQVLEEINDRGKLFTLPLKNGEIEQLRKANPPKDTWLFSKLEKYKQNVGSKDILYGSILMPSPTNSNLYSYNLFAYDIKKEVYYFVAIVSFKISENGVLFDQSYLFTEAQGLKRWWKTTFGFYVSETKDEIPEKYVFDVCPPPPFEE